MILSLGIVVEIGFLFGLDDDDAFDEIFVMDFGGIASEGEHTSFDADGFEHGGVEVIGAGGELVVVDLWRDVHLVAVDLWTRDRICIKVDP